MKIAVVTAIANEKDDLRTDYVFDGADFIAYTDQREEQWISRPLKEQFKDPVRNAKIHKVLIHNYADCDVSIWVDGNISFNVPPEQLVEQLLGDGDMWVMTNPGRSTIEEESTAIVALNSDANSEDVFRQKEHYREKGYRDINLYECNVIIRRHNKKTEAFNEKWWAEICTHSRRDQMSFPYALSKSDVDIRTSTGGIHAHPYFSYGSHNW